MSYSLQQSAEELKILVGSTISKVAKVSMDDEECIEVTFKLAKPIEVDGRVSSEVQFQVWADPEGNGPGFLALTGAA